MSFSQKLIRVSFSRYLRASGSTIIPNSAGPSTGQVTTAGGLHIDATRPAGVIVQNQPVMVNGTFAQFRISARISNVSFPGMGTLDLQIFGLPQSVMNDVSTLAIQTQLNGLTQVVVEAGDANGMGVVFTGTIKNAWGDYESMPAVSFRVNAYGGLYESTAVIPPTSFKGPQDVGSVIMPTIATAANLAYQNNGVSGVVLNDPYFYGSALDQMRACADHAHIDASIDCSSGTLAIWPKGVGRKSIVTTISPNTGMIDYPTFWQNGVIVKTQYNPGILHGGLIELPLSKNAPPSSPFGPSVLPQSATTAADSGGTTIRPAAGQWLIYRLDHHLECLMPNGKWESTIWGQRIGLSGGTT